jgi:hypothetical protein
MVTLRPVPGTPPRASSPAKAAFWICSASLLLSVPFLNCLGDDTFIYMRMIRNFLQYRAFEYNHGEPCYAMTSLTWFLGWAGLTGLLHDIDLARQVGSLIGHTLAFTGIYLLSGRLIHDRFVRLLTLAVVFFDPFYIRWFWGGWEVSLKIAAAAWALVAMIRIGQGRDRIGDCLLAGVAAGVGSLTRPEIAFLAGLGFIYLALRLPAARRAGRLSAYVVGTAVMVLPWLWFADRTFGWALPHTIFAKMQIDTERSLVLRDMVQLVRLVCVPILPLLVTTLVFAWSVWRRAGSVGSAARVVGASRDAILDLSLVAIWGLTLGGYLVRGVYIDSNKTSMFTPFLALAVGTLCGRLAAFSPLGRPGRMLSLALAATVLLSVGIDGALFYRFSVFNPMYRRGDDRRLIEFSERVRAATGPDDEIGLFELGVVGYYTDRYIVDFAGLATPEIVTYRMRFPTASVERYLHDRGHAPAWLVDAKSMDTDPASRAPGAIKAFFGYPYRAIFSQPVDRIGGRGWRQAYTLYRLAGPEPEAPGGN